MSIIDTQPAPACDGLGALFDSIKPDAHIEAAAICARCPILAACRQNRPSRESWFDGTWAGVLYKDGRVVSQTSKLPPCPVCDAGAGKACISKAGNQVGQPHQARTSAPPNCLGCGKPIDHVDRRYRYCSDECGKAARNQQKRQHDTKRTARAHRKPNKCPDCGAACRGVRCKQCQPKHAARIRNRAA